MENEQIILRSDGVPDETVKIPLSESGERFDAVGKEYRTEHDYATRWWLRDGDSAIFISGGSGSKWNPPRKPYYPLPD